MNDKYKNEIIRMINNLDKELIDILQLKKELQTKLDEIDNEKTLDIFEITYNCNDKITNSELRKYINSNNLINLKNKLKILGAFDLRTNKTRGLKGIKIKNN
jgi:hypothetical protein